MELRTDGSEIKMLGNKDGWVGKCCSYLNGVRVVQPQVVEPHGEAATGGVEDPHGALLGQIMCYVSLHYITLLHGQISNILVSFSGFHCIQCSSIGLIVL